MKETLTNMGEHLRRGESVFGFGFFPLLKEGLKFVLFFVHFCIFFCVCLSILV